MAQVSNFLRRGATGYIHYCPACDEAHLFTTDGGGPTWSFDGDVNRPTFGPSMRVSWGRFADPSYRPEPGDEDLSGICHYHLVDGELRFCGDSTHALAGQTVPLPELPDRMQGDKYGDGNP